MRVVSKGLLRHYWEKHQDCEQALKSWYSEAKKAEWNSPEDIRRYYPSASIIRSNRVIFNIKGNAYRLIVRINYGYGIIWIRFIGTHAEYDKINAETI